MPVVDASVYVTLFQENEEAHQRAWSWLREARSKRQLLSAPTILVAETAAALGRGLGDPVLAERMITQLLRIRILELVPVSRSLAFRAAMIASRHRIRGCDAVYVALAERLDDKLITLDRQQLERGSEVVATLEPTTGVGSKKNADD